ncbi:MAG: hypothetical protein ABEH64_07330 [Salinirussus sp.]
MGLTDLVTSVIGGDARGTTIKVYECQNCGETFETGKNKERRISCPECVSSDVEQVGTAE